MNSDIISIKQYAESRGRNYETCRAKVKRYAAELEGQIVTHKGTRYLTPEAVAFLDDHLDDSKPSVTIQNDQKEIAELKDRVIDLLDRLDKAKDKLLELQEQNATIRIESQNTISGLLADQAEVKRMQEQLKASESLLRAAEERQKAAEQQLKEKQVALEEMGKRVQIMQEMVDTMQENKNQKKWYEFWK